MSALISGLTVGVALGVVTGMWRESQRVEARHAVLGAFMTAISLCGIGGVVLCFGNQLLLAALVGGVAAFMNHQQGWIQWGPMIGVNPAPTPPSDAPPAPAPLFALNNPPAGAGVALAIVLLLAGVFFWGLGAIRSLETTGVAGDMGCTAPCGMQHGLWVQVMPDAQGKVVSQPAPGLVEMRLSFHDDEPGLKEVSRGEFSLSGPDSQTAYEVSLDRPGCAAWRMRLQLDDTGKIATVCFLVPEMDPAQLNLDWGDVVMPLGKAQPNFSLAVNAG